MILRKIAHPPEEIMKLLFIGNAHTEHHAMPSIVARFFEAMGQKIHVTMITLPGKDLAYHLSSPCTLFNIRHGEYDAVIAQDRASFFEPAELERNAKLFMDTVRDAGADACLYMPFAPLASRAQQKEMTHAYADFCTENKCKLAPVGEVFFRLSRQSALPSLYAENGKHASPFGSYVAAVTIYYILTQRKRIMRIEDAADPGVNMGFSPDVCRLVHAEAVRTVRLHNAWLWA
jgi:hypothetical protein